MKNTEKQRRKRISDSMKIYFSSENGIQHRKLLSELQRKRMLKYNSFIKDNDNKINMNGEIKY